MSYNQEKWLEMAEKVKGHINYPDDADDRINSVIETYGTEVVVDRIASFVQSYKLDDEIRVHLKEAEHVIPEEAIEDILLEGSPEHLRKLRGLLKDVSEFDFPGQRILTLATPLSEQMGEVETVKDVINMAKDEILWIFYAIYIAASIIVPAFDGE